MRSPIAKTSNDDSADMTLNLLHDAEMEGAFVDRANETARLDFRLENATHCSIELHGLKAFRCEDLTLQNVVGRVLQSREGQLSSADLEYWMNWITSLSDASSWLGERRKEDWLSKAVRGEINLVALEPSAGALLAAACERFALL
jgi:hypothetical protein